MQKCHILSISRERHSSVANYILGQERLSAVSSYPYLGVTISTNLRWNKHVEAISAKATKTLNFVCRNIYRCPPDVKALAYTSLIRPHLEFASAAWDPYTVSNTNFLDKVQRRAARFVKSDYRYTTSVSHLVSDLAWQSFTQRR